MFAMANFLYICLLFLLQKVYTEIQSGELNAVTESTSNEHDKLNWKIVPEVVSKIQDRTGLQWPMGIIPYYIDKNSYDTLLIQRVHAAMGFIEGSSCVIFKKLFSKPKGSNGTWLHFTNPSQERECVHEVLSGANGAAVVVLGYDCLRTKEILHTLLHAIGFKDEVSHPHRDQYIRILWDNIHPKYRPLFRIQFEEAPYKVVEYDPMSIMHFHDRAFSANGGATIAALVPGLDISPSENLSQLDIMKLRLSFGHECNKRKVGDLLDTCKDALRTSNLNAGEGEVKEDADDQENDNEASNIKDDSAGSANEELNAEDVSANEELNAEDVSANEELNAEDVSANEKLNAEDVSANEELNAEDVSAGSENDKFNTEDEIAGADSNQHLNADRDDGIGDETQDLRDDGGNNIVNMKFHKVSYKTIKNRG